MPGKYNLCIFCFVIKLIKQRFWGALFKKTINHGEWLGIIIGSSEKNERNQHRVRK